MGVIAAEDDVDVVVGTVQRTKQISARLGSLDADGSAAAAGVRAMLPAHSTKERQLDLDRLGLRERSLA